MSHAVRSGCVVLPDLPVPFPFALPAVQTQIRAALPAIEEGLGDDVAWAYGFTDEHRLSVYRTVHGNRKEGRRPRTPRRAPGQQELSLR